MVRLKAIYIDTKRVDSIFQFQYGAIEGILPANENDVPYPFQFQYGAIEGLFAAALRTFIGIISIPVWCD